MRTRGRGRGVAGRRLGPGGAGLELVSAVIPAPGPAQIILTFSETLRADSSQVGFTVTASGGAVSVNGFGLSENELTLLLDRSIAAGETVTVSYTTGGVTGLAPFADYPVDNQVV